MTLFLAGLAAAGVPDDQVSYRLSIHERADEVAARTWWATHVGVDPASSSRTTLERHDPKTVRHASGEAYRGCLTVSVGRGRELSQRLDGLVRALVSGVGGAAESGGPVP